MVFTEPRGEYSAEFSTVDVDRFGEIERRQERVAAFLEEQGLDAVLLQRPENVAWFTCGADVTRFGSGAESMAAILVTSDARVVATNDVDSPQIFEHELAGMGFQLKERPWHEDASVLVDDVCRGRTVGSDDRNERTRYLGSEIAALRLPLSPFEVKRLQVLGKIAAHAVEATCRKLEPGRNEFDIAGELAHRVVKYGAYPVRLVVQGDARGERYRHWTPQQFPVEHVAHVGVCARMYGLHVAVQRTVTFTRPDDEFVKAHHVAMLAQATGINFSRAGERMADVWAKVERIYDKFGHPDAWRTSDQAEIVGFTPVEHPVVPDGEHQLRAGEAIHWHTAVGGAVTGDTMIIGEEGGEVLTPMEEWPRLTIQVKDQRYRRPAILRRDRDESEV